MNDYLETALKAARVAGEIQNENLEKEFTIKHKGIADLVTEVDLKCEKEIISIIADKFPEHGFLAEEGGVSKPDADYVWIIDPLDGTTNFAHGYRRFCVSIALVHKGKIICGVVLNPVAKEEFTAVKGEGAFLNGNPISVSNVKKVEDGLICTGFSYDRGKKLDADLEIYLRVIPVAQSLRRDGSAALDICEVAAGRFDCYWERNLNAWDIAAGNLILQEAGGKWSGLDGEKTDLYSKQLLVSNGLIHDEMIKIIRGEA
jgi:myo-inositol-1(or 4)-monophosphatase